MTHLPAIIITTIIALTIAAIPNAISSAMHDVALIEGATE